MDEFADIWYEHKMEHDYSLDFQLLGFGSAQPISSESFLTGRYTTYYGRSQAVVRAGASGSMRFKVCGEGLQPLEKMIMIE